MTAVNWKENGILLSVIGILLLLLLAGVEAYIQEFTDSDDVLDIAIQNDAEVDSDENLQADSVLTPEELQLVASIAEQFRSKEPRPGAAGWKVARSEFPQASPGLWLDVAKRLYETEHYDISRMIYEGLLNATTNQRTFEVIEKHRETALFQLARIYSQDGRPAEAIKNYRAVLKTNPNHQVTLINLGLVLNQEKRYPEAVEVLNLAVGTNSGSQKAKALAAKGDALMAMQDYVGAQAAFEQSILYRPQHASTFRKLAETKVANHRDSADVLKTLSLAISLRSGYRLALIDRALYLWKMGRFNDARKDIETLLTGTSVDNDADWIALHFYIATGRTRQTEQQLGKLGGASLAGEDTLLLDAMRSWVSGDAELTLSKLKTIRKSEYSGWVVYYRAMALAASGQFSVAFEVMSTLADDLWLAEISQLQISLWHIKRQEYDHAANILKALQQAFPESAFYTEQLGNLYMESGAYPAAIAQLTTAAALAGDNRGVRLNLARAFVLNKQFSEAQGVLESVLNDYPNHITSLFDYGVLLKNMGRAADAEQQFRKILLIEPGHTEVLYLLSEIYIIDNRMTDAEEMLIALLQEDASQVPARQRLIGIYDQTNQWSKAVAEVDRLLALIPEDAAILILKADFLRELGDLAGAGQILLKSSTTGQEVTTRLRLLARLALNAGNTDLAAILIEKLSTGNNRDRASLVLRLELYNRTGQFQRAIDASNEAGVLGFQTSPQKNAALEKLVIAHFNLGHHQEVVTLLEPLLDKPGLPDDLQRLLNESERIQRELSIPVPEA